MNFQGNMALQVSERIEKAKRQNGERILLDDVQSLVDSLIDGIVAEAGAENRKMESELREVLDYVVRAKQEFMSIGPRALSAKKIPDANEELNAILGATEEAAGQIMDAADQVGELVGKVDEPTGEELQNISTRLYEASAFQDICGQRITKVLAILKFLEGRLATLAETRVTARWTKKTRQWSTMRMAWRSTPKSYCTARNWMATEYRRTKSMLCWPTLTEIR